MSLPVHPTPETALIFHAGGGTPVLNASLAGAVSAWRRLNPQSPLLGARSGVAGYLDGDPPLHLTATPAEQWEGIARTPGSALGSSRRRLTPAGLPAFRRRLLDHSVRWLLPTGGNGTMSMAAWLAAELAPAIAVIGIPKTIDNDLEATDHTPGYPSAARFFAHAVRDIGLDNRGLPSPVTVVEVLGRHTGWLAAACALARFGPDEAPHLIYFPEAPPTPERVLDEVQSVHRRLRRVVIAVCEGQTDHRGDCFDAEMLPLNDPKARPLAANLGHALARWITARTGLRARAEKPGLLGRSCGSLVSGRDRQDAFRCGEAAVEAVLQSTTASMVALDHHGATRLVPLAAVAGKERPFPSHWMNGSDVTTAFLEWARPLVGEIRPVTTLW